jgi:DNA-binding MarR family transcriptional regulator
LKGAAIRLATVMLRRRRGAVDSCVITHEIPCMTSPLQKELRQKRPFSSHEEEALLSIMRTAAQFAHLTAESLKEFGITPTQYNVLRILRGARPDGLCRNEVRDRLVAEVPDVTRLLDRMEESGLIVRKRDSEDRRIVNTMITPAGLKLLAQMDAPVAAAHKELLGHLGRRKLMQLSALLAEARKAE